METEDIQKIQELGCVKMHSTVTVGTKGQVVIPVEVRNLLGLKPGDNLMVITKHDKAIGMVKMDDLDVMMEYMQQEINAWKREVKSS